MRADTVALLLVFALVLSGCAGAPSQDGEPGDDANRSGDGADQPPPGPDPSGGGSGQAPAVRDPLTLNTTVERTSVGGEPAANVTLEATANGPDLPPMDVGVRAPAGFPARGENGTTFQTVEQGSTYTWSTSLSLPAQDARGLLRTWATAEQRPGSRVSATETHRIVWENDELSTQPADWPHDSQGGLVLDVQPTNNGTAHVDVTLYTNETTPGSTLVVDAIDGSASITIEHPEAVDDGSLLPWEGTTSPDGTIVSFNLSLTGQGQAQASLSFLAPLHVDAAQYSGSIVLSVEDGEVTIDQLDDTPPPQRDGGQVEETG